MGTCQSQTSLALAPDAPDGVLFMVDRSAGMATDYQGEPRWQMSGHALVGALTPLASDQLRVGALFYPSSTSNAPSCSPAWLCPRPIAGSPPAAQTCGVSALSADDQLEVQPATQAVAQLNASSDLYASIAGEGVPVRESIDRADAAMSSALRTGRASVVLVVNAQPSCRWDETQSVATLNAWRTQRNVTTHVIAVPGADQAGMAKFTALARAGGSARVIAPTTPAALQSALQSVVAGSLNTCTLTLDPPVTDIDRAHLIVGIHGVEQEIKRSADDGQAQWTISADGMQLNLLGKLCASAMAGDYDSLRVAVGCVQYPVAAP